jgi:hypothetical protein
MEGISYFPTFNHIIQYFHNFSSRRFPVKSVDLQDIDIDTKTRRHTCIHGIKDVLARESPT